MMWRQLKMDFCNEREDTIFTGVAHQKHYRRIFLYIPKVKNKIEEKGENKR